MKLKKILSMLLVFGLLLSAITINQNSLFGGRTENDIFIASQTDRDNAKNELDDVNSRLEDLEDDYNYIEQKLSKKAEELSDLLADKAILEADISNTQAAIDQTKLDLQEAEAKQQKAYNLMKVRIRYMYENSTQDSIWDAILNSDGITDLLNRVEYINQVHKTDRDMLEEYKAIVQEIELLAQELDSKMNDMVALQEIYERQEEELAVVMAELETDAENYQEQIAAAEKRAGELADYIEEQNRLIAIKQQEEEKRRQEQQQNNINTGNNANTDGNTNSGDTNNGSTETTKPSTSGGYLTDASYDPPYTSNVTGQEIVNYALQFVGNPYVWGGNSLTNGCDCSGFVNAILKNFGFSGVPRYSQAFKNYGQPVAFENIKAGDIVIYPGHVAIYIGNGCIVEAQSSRAGITSNRSVTCNTITGIRRVL